jgi:hypothetical protein
LIGQSPEDGFTVPKFQYGIVIIAKHQTFHRRANIIDHGKKNHHLKNAANAIVLNLLAKIEHSILGWILASLHYLSQNTKGIKSYIVTAIRRK